MAGCCVPGALGVPALLPVPMPGFIAPPPGMPAQPASTAAATVVIRSERILKWRMVWFPVEKNKIKNNKKEKRNGMKKRRSAQGRHHTPALQRACHGG